MKTKQEVIMTVNGVEKSVFVRHADTLLHVLREKLGVTSVKPSCHNGDCGACTVLVDGTPFNACHLLAIEMTEQQQIMTIDGLTDPIIQEKFIENSAIQCGYCTSGFILNCFALLTSHPDADDVMIDEWLDSNICRCTGYQEIKESMNHALLMRKADSTNVSDDKAI